MIPEFSIVALRWMLWPYSQDCSLRNSKSRPDAGTPDSVFGQTDLGANGFQWWKCNQYLTTEPLDL